MKAYELLAHLRHLVLSVEDGEIEWWGSYQQHMAVTKEIEAYENNI